MALTEEDKLEQWAVNLINDYEAAGNYSSSQPKRIKRFSGELVANPEAYYELLDMARSQNMSGKQLVQSIRSIESQLLDEASKGTKTSRKQLLSDVIHHFYAQRTGGDTLRRLGQADRKEVRNILRGEFGKWGNVDENLITLFRSWHGNWEKAKGREAEALAQMGLKPEDAGKLPTIKAHQTSASSSFISGTAKGDTVSDALSTMRPQFELQQRESGAAIEQARPAREALTELAGGVGETTSQTAEELARQRKILEASPETSNIIKGNIEAVLDFSKSSVSTRGLLKRGVGRLILPSAAGSAISLALGAGDVQAREERVKQDPSFINKLQAGLAQTERAADVAGLVPGPQSIVAEPVGFVSGLANVGIDAARDPIGTLQAVGGSFKWLVGGGAAKQQRQILNPLSTRL